MEVPLSQEGKEGGRIYGNRKNKSLRRGQEESPEKKFVSKEGA